MFERWGESLLYEEILYSVAQKLGRSLAMRQVVTFQGLLAIMLSDIHCCDRQGDSVSSMVDSPRLVVYMGNNSAIL